MNFKDRVVLITGASSGIGQRLAADLAARGAIVVGCGRSRERLQETGREIQRIKPNSQVVVCDVGDQAQVQAMVSKVLTQFGKIDILINNAGVGMRKPFAETSLEVIESMVRTNLLGTIYCTHEVLPSMIERRSGHIVNISSVAGKIGALNTAAYCATKFAMDGFSESLYHELRPLGIYMSVVSPGPVRTDFNRLFADAQPKPPQSLVLSTEAVSRAVIRAIEKKQFEAILPHSLALACFGKRLMPNLFRQMFYHALRWHAGNQNRVV